MTDFFRHYAFPADVLRDLDRTENVPPNSLRHSQSHGISPSKDWDLNTGYARALTLYAEGWHEGAERAERVAKELTVKSKRTRRTYKRGVTGAFPIVPAYLAGNPLNMMQPARKNAHGQQFLTLYVPTSYNGNVSADAAADRGAAFVALVDILETAGVRVRVIAVLSAETVMTGRDHVTTTFAIKDYGDPLALDLLAFSVAHPAFLRRIGFRLIETDASRIISGWSVNGSYGRQAKPRGLDVSDACVVFPYLSDACSRGPSAYLAEAWAQVPANMRGETS